jgi:integrase
LRQSTSRSYGSARRPTTEASSAMTSCPSWASSRSPQSTSSMSSGCIERLVSAHGSAPIARWRWLRKCSPWRSKWRLRPDNPCKGVERNREDARKRYLKPDELERLTKALAEHPNKDAADVFRLLLLTGARSGEALGATWDQFDLDEGTWIKPATATKQKERHEVPLNAPARQLLARRLSKRDTSPWVFPGRRGQHRIKLDDSWQLICRAAGITGLRIHDLRHSYASTLAGAGFSLPTIGALLGHSQPQTTARYAHLFDDPLRKATERAGAILAPKTKPSGKVTTFPARAGK